MNEMTSPSTLYHYRPLPHQRSPLSLQHFIAPLHINNLLHSLLIPVPGLKSVNIRTQLRMLFLREESLGLRSR